MRLLHVYFWNNTIYWMVQNMGFASFTCDSFDSSDTWLFSFLNENNKFKKLLLKISHILQPRVIYSLFSYYLKILKIIKNTYYFCL